MADEPARTRRELMAPYERPYRHALAETWRGQPDLRRATVAAAALWPIGAVGFVVGSAALEALVGLGATFVYVLIVVWIAMVLRSVWRVKRSWRRTTELGTVRVSRPQAGTEDPEVAHDEFAVTVEEDGQLVTWRFRPPRASEEPDDLEIEVPGRPRFAASPVDTTSFDAEDTARASEQLVAAQGEAAQREAAAAAEAHARLDADRTRETLAREARSTAAALQRVTGQRRRGQ